MENLQLTEKQIETLLVQLGVKDAKFDTPETVETAPANERVSSDQRDWDWLEKAPKNDVKKVIFRRELDAAEQAILVLRGDHDLIMTYLADRVFTGKKALIYLVERQNLEEIIACTKRSALPDEALVFLIEKGFAEPRRYILRKGMFSLKGEMALIKSNRAAEIRMYAKRWPMYPLSVREIIKRGKHDEIMLCIKHKNAMFGENLRLLIERGNREEIAKCLELSYPDVKIPE